MGEKETFNNARGIPLWAEFPLGSSTAGTLQGPGVLCQLLAPCQQPIAPFFWHTL